MVGETIAAISFIAFHAINFPVPGFSETTTCRMQWEEPVLQNKGNILLGGAARCGPYGSRSVLIHSKDYGQTWREVAKPFVGRRVQFLQAVTPMNMFAVQSHVVEGSGPDTLVKSTDGGRRWVTVGEIPKGENPNQIVVSDLKFIDRKRGSASLKVSVGSGSDVRIDLATSDAGLNWKFVGAKAQWPLSEPEKSDADVLQQATGLRKINPVLEVQNNHTLLLLNGKKVTVPNEVLLSLVAETSAED